LSSFHGGEKNRLEQGSSQETRDAIEIAAYHLSSAPENLAVHRGGVSSRKAKLSELQEAAR
jgi:hypothetical protein